MSSSFLNSSPSPSFPLILSSPISPSSSSRLPYKSLPFSLSKTLSSFSLSSLSTSSSSSFLPLSFEEEDHVIGDCIVFEEDAFEDPFPLQTEPPPNRKPKKPPPVKPEDLIPAEWKEAQAEINMSKKDKKMIAQQLQFGSRIERIKKVRSPDMVEYASYRDMKSRQLKPVVLDSPIKLPEEIEMGGPRFSENEAEMGCSSSGRVMPRNPRLAVAESSLEDIKELFDSDAYKPGENSEKNSEGRRKLFTKEEKVLLNKRIPNVAAATSNKWLPLHTLAASGEFYLVDKLLKNNVDVNAVDKDGLTALHKAILCKKQAITNYLLRESANPFVRDKEGATLMHYAIRAASSQTVKILLLYNVDINLPDEDGWTPLHLAVQTQRTDLVRLLLIKGADKTLKNREGLTPLDLCLYLGRDVRTYELIKLLKELPKSK